MHVRRVETSYLARAAEAGQLYALIDACVGGEALALVAAAPAGHAACLYQGMAARHYGDKAPYLLRVDRALLDALPQLIGISRKELVWIVAQQAWRTRLQLMRTVGVG